MPDARPSCCRTTYRKVTYKPCSRLYDRRKAARREPIEYPNAKIVEGFAPVMLPYQFTDDEFEAMIAYAVERLAES